MDLSALRQQILLSNKTASEKAETFLLKSQVNDLSKEVYSWDPEVVEKGIGMAVLQEASLMLAQQQQSVAAGLQPSPPVLSIQDVEDWYDHKIKRPKSSQSPGLAMMTTEVAEVETCPTFALGSNAVVDSHAGDTIEGLKPDIVVVSTRFNRTALSVVTFIKVVRGDMDLMHIGKVIAYLLRLMKAQANRTHVYGVLTNLEYTTLYHCIGSKIGHTQPVKYEEGGFALLISLLKSADSTLGHMAPELNLPMLNIFPLRVLGTGHNSNVYEALLEEEQTATRHAVKVL
ncbi:hypothetical protein WJX77_005430 [Trebouxia sp. C0004]